LAACYGEVEGILRVCSKNKAKTSSEPTIGIVKEEISAKTKERFEDSSAVTQERSD